MQIPIESLNLLMLNVGQAHHNGDWNWQNVNSPFTRIYYVTEGRARLHLPDQTVELHPEHLYIVPAYTTHSYECNEKFVHYYLHVYEGYKKETDVFELYEFPIEVPAAEGDALLFKLMCEKHPEARVPASDPRSYDNTSGFAADVKRYSEMPLHEKMALRGAILMLFSRFLQRAAPRVWTSNERLIRVLKYIHQNIYADIGIDTLADVACVTRPYLARLFKQHLGATPLQYINRKKMERAELLLLTSDATVKETAYALGFNDHSYFIRLFKKVTGRTPQEYRKAMQ